MIIVAGPVRIHPGVLQEALPILHTMEEASNAEAGCVAYHFYVDPADDTLLFIYEEWIDEDALQAHRETPHMAAFRAELPRFLAGEPQLQRYRAEPAMGV